MKPLTKKGKIPKPALQESEEFYRSIVQSAQEGIWRINAASLTDYVNPKMAQMMGYQPEEMLGRPIDDFLDDEGRVMLATLIERRKGGISEQFEFKYIRKDGSDLWASVSTNPITNAQGVYVGAVALLTDIRARRAAEVALAAEQTRLRTVLDLLPVSIYVKDTQNRFLVANKGLAEALGASSWEEMIGKTDADYFPPAIAAAFREDEARVLAGEPVVNQEGQSVAPDGRARTELTTKVPLHDDEGKIIGLVGVSRDITERKQAESALHEFEERYKLLADNTDDIVGLNDTQGNRLYISPSYFRKTGWTPDDLNRKHWRFRIHPDDIETVERARLENLGGKVTQIEHRIRCKDGSWLWCETSCKPIPGPDGKIWRLLVWSHDITVRRKAELELQESEEQFRAIFEQAAVGVAMIDSNTGRFLKVNQRTCEIARLTQEQMLDETFMRITHPDDLQADLDNMEKLKKGKIRTFTMEKRYLYPDGATIWINLTVSPMWQPGDKPTRHIAVVEDITYRKQAEEELRNANQKLRLHFEQTPMAVIEWDLDFRVLRWNPAAQTIFGFSSAEAVGQHAAFIIPKNIRHQVSAVWQSLMIQKGGERSSNTNVRKDGKMILCEWYNTPLIDDQGAVAGVASLVLDISEKKEAEAALLESEGKFRAIFDQAAVGVALIDTNTGHFLNVNQRCCDIIGLPREQLTPRTFMDITYPQDMPLAMEHMQRLKAGVCRSYTLEKRNLLPNGEVKWINLSIAAMWLPGEAPTRHIAVLEDITDRKNAEAKYLRELKFNETLVDHTSVIIVLLDRQGRMEFVNQATVDILGYSRKELVGRTPWAVGIIGPKEKLQAVERLHVLLKGGGSNPPRETILKAKDGKPHVFSVSSVSTCAPDGSVDRIIVTGTDLTERNRLQREILKISEQEQARIGHNLHDGVGQTMTGVATLMEALESELDGEQRTSAARIRHLLQDAIHEIRRMSHSMSPAAVRNRGLEGVLQLLADTIRINHRTTCTCKIDPGICIGDVEKETHIYRIAQEAANNAIRHGKPTKINISLRHLGEKGCVLKIQDNGLGIKKSKTIASEGIGLQVMDYRANLIGGTLKIDSKSRRGVVVTCRFPCAPNEA